MTQISLIKKIRAIRVIGDNLWFRTATITTNNNNKE